MWLGGALFGMAAHFINVIKDMKEDHVSGIQGLPQTLGTQGSIVAALTLITLGMLTLLFYL
jgi:4-hydroxybenzoate polyprenyltransferase